MLLLVCASIGWAQDPFEIQVYEYPTVPKGKWNLETHINYVGKGTKRPDGTESPSHNQLHTTFELTRGITENFELAGYLVMARRPGINSVMEFAAWRIRPRVRVPEAWNWPVGVSLSTEFAFPRKQYEEARTTLEIRPIIEKKLGRWQLDFNPVVGKAIAGRGSGEGWDFEPGTRIGYTVNPKFELSLEYYGSLGPVGEFFPTREQVHQIFPGFDWNIRENVVWNWGIGVGVTGAGNRLVYKWRIGYMFGKGEANP